MVACFGWFTRWLKNSSFSRKVRTGRKRKNKVDASSGEVAGTGILLAAEHIDLQLLSSPHPSVATSVSEKDPSAVNIVAHADESREQLKRNQMKIVQLKLIESQLGSVSRKLAVESKLRTAAVDRLQKYKSAQRDVARLRQAIIKHDLRRRREFGRLGEENGEENKTSNDFDEFSDEEVREALSALDQSYSGVSLSDHDEQEDKTSSKESEGISENSKTESEIFATEEAKGIEEEEWYIATPPEILKAREQQPNYRNYLMGHHQNYLENIEQLKMLRSYDGKSLKQGRYKLTNAYKWRRWKNSTKQSRWPY